MSSAIRKNSEIQLYPIDENVWGLYNCSTGKHIFVDGFDHAMISLVDTISSREEIKKGCSQILSRSLSLTLDIDKRLDRLFEFGILTEANDDSGQVLLIDPPAACEHQVGMRGPAMGLCYLSAALARHGLLSAKILDLRSVSPIIGYDRAAAAQYFSRNAAHLSPAIVGITAVSATIDNALFIGQLAKLLYPECFLVLGGPHASYRWQKLLSLPFVDAVVCGEGELPFPRMVERVLQRDQGCLEFPDIQGVAWRGANGQPVSTGWCGGVENVDQLAVPDVHDGLINGRDFKIEFARIMSSRGCPFTCSFCSTATFTGRRVRYRTIDSVVAEIKRYFEVYGISGFVFDDDIFTINRKRTLELCQAITSLPFVSQLKWGCNTRIDCINDELIDSLYLAGCRSILFGVESGDIDVQTRFAKGKRGLEGFQHKIERMLEKGMEPELNFIIGLPGENTETIGKIGTMIQNFPEVPCSFNFLTILPGTPLEQQMTGLGISFLGTQNSSRYSMTAPTVSTPTMSAEEQIKAYLHLQWVRQCRAVSRTQMMENPNGPMAAINVDCCRV